MKKYPLYQSQLGVFLECQTYPDSLQYNLPEHIELDRSYDTESISQAWKKLIHSSAGLRARFDIDDEGNPCQWPDDTTPVNIPVMRMNEAEAQEYIHNGFIRPFNVLGGKEPLFHVELIETQDKLHILMDFHHLIMDGVSYSSILERELYYYLSGREKPVDLSYFEMAEEEQEYFRSKEYQEAREYFVGKLKGAEMTGLSDLPLATGQRVTHSVSIEKSICNNWCEEHQIDVPTLFQAAFALSLGRLARTEDAVYCTSFHSRMNRRMMRTLGMFVNNVALSAKLSPELTVTELLQNVKRDTASAYVMGRYPFPHLSRELGLVPRVSFNFRPFRLSLKLGDRRFPLEELSQGKVHMDMNVHIKDSDERYEIFAESSDSVNDAESVRMFVEAINAALRNMMNHSEAPLKEIALVSDDDGKEIIRASAGESLPYDSSKIWLDLFAEQVRTNPNHNAVADENGIYSYSQLAGFSDSVSQFLLNKGVKPGDWGAVRTGRTKQFLVAAIGVWKAGAAYVPIDLDAPEERLNFMMKDSGAKLLLDDESILEAQNTEVAEPFPLSNPSSIAYMIYTSGSIGRPKGVAIPQSAMLNLVHFIRKRWGHTQDSRIACHSNFAFDASVEDLYPVLTVGGTLYIVPENARKDILLMREYIRKNKITGGCYTTQFAQLLGDTDEPLALKYMVLGGEKMTAIPNITGTIYNTYGPTEFTVDATWCRIEPGNKSNIPIGRPLDNCSAFILDNFGNLLPRGATGELCLSGPQLALGYWNLPEKTQEVFQTIKFSDGKERKIYRTGDLARYNAQNELEYFGRIDFQVKLHGFRIELGEIDSRAMSFAGIRQAVSQVRKDRIVLYYVSGEKVSEAELRSFLAETMPEYMVPSVYVALKEFPMTANGKVNLKALPEPELQAEEIAAPETETEAIILSIVKSVLGFKEIGVTTNLVSAGMNSLDTMRLNVALTKELGLSLKVAEILKAPTVRDIAAVEKKQRPSTLHHAQSFESYPITENQRGVYLDWEMNRESTQYNMPAVYLFENVELSALKHALTVALNSHSYLKTRLKIVSGSLLQIPHPKESPNISVEALDAEPEISFFQEMVKPFDLLSDCLYRAGIYYCGNKTYLFLDIHHIICDGLSFEIFWNDVIAVLHSGKPLAETVTAYDYALWENDILSGEKIQSDEAFFAAMIRGSQAVSFPNSETPDGAGKSCGLVEITMPREEVDAYSKFCGVTPGSFLQSSFALALKRLTREDRPLYLTVSNGRSDTQLANTVGMFVKTLPSCYAADNDASETCKSYVQETYKQLQEIYAREIVPYTLLAEKYGLNAEIMFAYQGGLSDEVDGAKAFPLTLNAVKFPLMMTVFQEESGYLLRVEYDGMRYSQEDMRLLAHAVSSAALSLTRKEFLHDVSLVDDNEAEDLIRLGLGEAMERDESETVLTLLKKRAEATPNAPALVFHDKTLTYREVDEVSTRIAVHLRERFGIGRGDNVGVMIGRSELMLLYPMAVIKTGAAYMPLDPNFPPERLYFMCKDAGVRLILSEKNLVAEKLPDFSGDSFDSSEITSLPEASGESLPSPNAHDLLVILFTSGTTGQPKAVELEHYGVVNYCHWYAKEFGLTMNDHIAGYANFGFDAHMIDLYPSILAGSTVYLFDEAMRMDITAMNAYMEANNITVAFLTTQIGCIISEINHSLRCLSTGGEKMPPVTPPSYRFLNVYGPTECSLFSTYYDVPGYFEGNLIGRPLSNYQLYVIDTSGQLVPRGAKGELLIGGQGVARGYLNRPELTSEKFISFKPLPELDAVRAYRSGDLVRWDEGGNIEYFGRIDRQVKLRGLRIELGEVENAVASFPGISQTVVDVKGKTNPQLCCYYTSEFPIDDDALKARLSETLTEYMVPSVYMRLDKLPLNPNGKVDRNALPEPEITEEEFLPPETESEKEVFAAVSKLLGTEAFGVTSNLIAQGMSSLAAMRLAAVLETQYGLKIRVADIMKHPTVRNIAAFGKSEDEGKNLHHVPECEEYPITENQKGLWIDWELHRDTTQYNIPSVYVFDDVPGEKLAAAVREAVDAHSYMKTRLELRGDKLLQRPGHDGNVEIPVTALPQEPDAKFFQRLVVPFDLLNDSLYRFHIYTHERKTYLFMDIHHIIFDGISSGVFMSDILSALGGASITPETVTAYDYAVYEQKFLRSPKAVEYEAYFDSLLDGVTSAGYPDSAKPDEITNAPEESKLGTLSMKINAEPVDVFCQKYAVTPGAYLQAAFGEVFQSLTREEKPMYLTISNGRSADTALQGTVGMYVRTLPVVFAGNAENHGGQSVADYVRDVQNQLQMTFEREDYPYTKIVEKHRMRADIMVTWQGGVSEGKYANAPKEIPLELQTAKLPILITTYPENGCYVLMMEYDKSRYCRKDMETLLSCMANCASSMAMAKRIRDISFLSDEEKAEILRISAGEKLSFDRSKTWLSMFSHWVETQPDHVAVTDTLGELTYKQLDKESDRVASWLISQGVLPDDFVIIRMHRFKEFAVAVIGIQKAGACYVPIDPNYPEERISYMVKDSGAKVVLDEKLIAKVLDTVEDPGHVDIARPENLAYMIYTSGSTGRPKGTMIPHSALMNYVQVYTRMFEVTPEDRISHHITFSFDSHIRDFYPALAAGASLHFMPDEITREPDQIFAFLESHNITGSAYATAMGMMMLKGYDLKQRFVSIGGEAMIGIRSDSVRVFNVCGATEVTDVVCNYELEKGRYYDSVPIGKPMPNTWAFIADKNGHLLPQGVPGEICYAGLNVGKGYWNLPDKTAQAFTECPYVEGERMYHTGDLGRYDDNGDVEHLGRLDFQVKLRGFRIELGEIESRAVQYPGIKQVAAAVKKDTLVLYYVADEKIAADVLRDFLAQSLTAYMVPSSFVQMSELPMTPSGKIDRKNLPEPKLSSSASYIQPDTDEERAVAESMKTILGCAEEIGAMDNFFELGGDSIKAIRMVSLLRDSGYRVQVADIMNHKTVRAIAGLLHKEDTSKSISQQPFKGIVPDSAIVRYFKYLELPEPQHYDQATLWLLRENFGRESVQAAVDALVLQHDMLRAVYVDGGLLVRPSDARITVQEAQANSSEEITDICGKLQASIRMSEALLNVTLIHHGDREYLFIAAHHLIIDGVSWRIIASDLESAFSALKRGGEIVLPMKTSTYADYAEALQNYRNSSDLVREIPYWENVQRQMLSLPVSHEKDYGRTIKSASFIMDSTSTAAFLRSNFAAMNAGINDALLTAVCLSYAAMSGEDTVSVQLEGHGREVLVSGESLVTDRTVGWFTSIYPVVFRNISKAIPDTFVEVKESLHRIPNKGFGYNVLRFIEGKREFPSSGDSIARIGFNYLGEMDSEQSSEGGFLCTSDIPVGDSLSPRNTFGNDISINALVENGTFKLYITYDTGKFEQSQIEEFTNDIVQNMKSVSEYLSTLTEKRLTATDLGETEWTDSEFCSVLSDFAARGETISRIYPLTPMQEGMLFKYLSEPESWAYRIVSIFELDVLPTELQLANVLARLGEKHEVLRTAVIYDGVKTPRQAIIERKLIPNMADLSGEADPLNAVKALRVNILNNAFELQRKPLFQLTCAKKNANSCYLIIAIHHIIEDGWCMGIYMKDLLTFLNEELTGIHSKDIPPEKGRYERAVREILAKDRTEGLIYWSDLLSDYETRTEIPSSGNVPFNEQSDTSELYFTTDRRTTDKFLALCGKEGATPSNGIELAWGLTLQVYSRTDDSVFGKVVSGRDNTEQDVSDLVGAFINTVPVRVKLGKDSTARQMLRELQKQAAETNKYDFIPLSEIQKQTELGSDLFQSIIAFQNYDGGISDEEDFAGSFDFSIHPVVVKEENFDEITPSAYVNAEGCLCLNLVFNRKHYRKDEVEAVGRLFCVLVEGMSENPDKPLKDIPRISASDLPAVMTQYRGEELPYDAAKTWLDLFALQVSRNPSAVAVEDENSSMTYGELDEASNRVANWLISQGVHEYDFVAVKMGRVKEFVAVFTGIQKAGAAYVPIDPAYPEERIAWIEEDSDARITITEDTLPEILAADSAPVMRTSPEHYAYMIYTSGSTGKPKGAILYQKGLMNFTVSMIHIRGFSGEDRISCHQSFSFDSHICDFYPELSSGASVHIMPERIRKDVDQIHDFLTAHRITGGDYTTALAKILKNSYALKQRFISCGGEALQNVASDDVIVYNDYGPTECTCNASVFALERGVRYDTVPIGRPIPNCWCFLVDQHGNLVPPEVRGEICIAGPNVGFGYWKRPEQTAEVFEECPFIEGTRMYHTGDLGYYRNGQLMYVGRMDFQVKLHGFRIELGEIENRAAQYSGIGMVSAQVKQDTLVLYYTSDGEISPDSLKAFMSQTLTEYMIPSVYIHLDNMPMTPNGKIDRKALPEPDISSGIQNVPPENRLEENCLRIAREVLPGVEFGVTDSLTSVGLNSLSAMLLTSRITSELRMKLRVSDVMRYNTIRGFVRGHRRINWLYQEYDDRKPTLIFIQGIVLLNDTAHLHRLLSEKFNVLVFEPIQNHSDMLFQGEHYDQVVEFYSLLSQMILPKDAKISGIIGFSFGGELAFGMAEEWKRRTGQSITVIMGDSTLPESGRHSADKTEYMTAEILREMAEAFAVKEHDYTHEELQILADLNNLVSRICSENSLAPYDGRVIFLNAHRNSTDKAMKVKLDRLAYYAPKAEIHEFDDVSHAGLFMNEQLHPFYQTLMKSLLEGVMK